MEQKATLCVLGLAVLMHFAGLLIFMKGFFPSKNNVEGYAIDDEIDVSSNVSGHVEGKYKRLVIMLVDALRADYVYNGSENNNMPYLFNILNARKGQAFKASAHPPTVTMPRIKAMMSGDIPGFIDVVLNFRSDELKVDNVIHQLKHQGKKVIFYGDDTWIRLFPHSFTRHEGTTSFFVSDYTEVDNNVTRHIDDELKAKDWDVMVLHYLGLDHIGHTAGPWSSLVAPKLLEMDKIIEKIHKWMINKTSRQDNTLFVICGDHGMSDQGSHGGSSPSETLTPLVFIGKTFEGSSAECKNVYQIDLVPMLAVLMGFPTPLNNLGVLDNLALRGFSPLERLVSAHRNARQIVKLYNKSLDNSRYDSTLDKYERTLKAHQEWLLNRSVQQNYMKIMDQYLTTAHEMRDSLAKSLLQYDLYAMCLGIVILWTVLLTYMQILIPNDCERNYSLSCSVLGTAVCCAAITISINFIVCTSSFKGENLCPPFGSITLIGILLLHFCHSVLLAWNIAIFTRMKWKQFMLNIKDIVHSNALLLIGTIGHTLSLMSSSFVEEEHQTWYFITITVLLLLCIKCVVGVFAEKNSSKTLVSSSVTENYSHIRCYESDYERRSFDFRNEAATLKSKNGSNYCKSLTDNDMNQCWSSRWHSSDLVAMIVILILYRLLRSWNQTGDKWAHLPDIGDWLIRNENKSYLSILVALSLVTTFMVIMLSECTTFYRIMMAVAVIEIYMYRGKIGDLWLPDGLNYISKGVLHAQVVYAILAVCFICKIFQINITSTKNALECYGELLKSGQSLLSVLGLILLRPHNIIEFCMIILVEHLLNSYIVKKLRLSMSSLTIIYLWLGHASFFQQGGSNSLATVDVSSGYVGLTDYNPVIIGILMAVCTYIGPLFWMTSFFKIMSQTVQNFKICGLRLRNSCVIVLLCRCLVVSFYSTNVLLLRYHLFVWTVFSPKLLYEAMQTAIMFVLVISSFGLYHLVNLFKT